VTEKANFFAFVWDSKGFSLISEKLCFEEMGNPYCSRRERILLGAHKNRL
jgi:hypothetical protein